MDYLLTRESKFPGENFEPGEMLKDAYEEEAQFLVVGAGGLGCEILKNLALCKVKHIFVVDLDTIELSNLNRQFLFREKDIGQFKAKIACEYIKSKYPNIDIQWSNKRIQAFTDDEIRQFHLIIGGLDNLEARKWINEKVHDLVEFDENGNPIPETVIPFIDGGTEGFRGQSRVIIPYKTPCFVCVDPPVKQNTYALCTIAERPRIPEHCIEYSYIVEWKNHHDKPVDKDSEEDIQWIYEHAKKRADGFNIEGVTYNLTLGVIKNIIPAIASTNALIAASTCMEAIKLFTGISKPLNNYFMYMGHEGLYADTSEYHFKNECKVCSIKIQKRKVLFSDKWKDVYYKLKNELQLSDNCYINDIDYLITKGKECDNSFNKNIQQLIDEKIIDPNHYLRIQDDDKDKIYKIKLIA